MLKVGDKYPLIEKYAEGCLFEVDEEGLRLIVNCKHPGEAILEACSGKQGFELRFCEIEQIIFFTHKCGDMRWAEIPYNIHLSRTPDGLPPLSGDEGYTLNLTVTDSADNTVKQILPIRLGHAFSQELYEAAERQKAHKVLMGNVYDEMVQDACRKYTTKDMVNLSDHKQRWKMR